MKETANSENNTFIAKWEAKESDTYTIYKDGKQVAWLFCDGGFNLQTLPEDGEVELDPEDLIFLCQFVTTLKIDLALEFQN